MKCQKMKKYLYRGLSVFMGLYLSLCSCIGSFASDSTSSGSSDTWTMDAETFLYYAFNGLAKEISSPYVVWNSFGSLTYDGFNYWLQNTDNGEHYHVLDDGTVVGHGGAGYTRDVDKINNSEYVEVEPELQQLILNYVHYEVAQNPLQYTECYIPSYSYMSPDMFVNSSLYFTLKEFIKNQNGFVIVRRDNGNVNFVKGDIVVVPRIDYFDFVGTTSAGSFTNVGFYYRWNQYNLSNLKNISGVKQYKLNENGTITEYDGTLTNWSSMTNSTNFNVANKVNIFTNYSKNELVYVFNTLNSLKNYNSGSPQPYYMTSEGLSNSNWSVSGSGIINTGSMNNSGNYYSNVTNGVGANWTPDQILELVDLVVNSNSGSGGSSGDSNNNSKWWERIGNAIGNLIDGLVEVLSTVIEHLSDALLSVIHLLTGYTDDSGVVHEGLFGKLLNLVNSGFNNFLASIFSWLPEEIVTLFTAVLVFGIFFGLLKMLRR